MQVYHDSRDGAYRFPFGAVAPDTEVTLSVDITDAPGAQVQLRTWTDAHGEQVRDMRVVEPSELPENTDRYQIAFTPSIDGITWYHFIITDAQGASWRYGAQHGQTGGTGQLMEWEPPSFQLTAFAPRLVPPPWHEAINGFLHDEAAGHELADVIATLIENYPFEPFRPDLPWRREGNEPGAPIAPAYFLVNNDVFGFWRYNEGNEPICILANASPRVSHDIAIPMPEEAVTELLTGYYAEVMGSDEARELDKAPSFDFETAPQPGKSGARKGRFAHVRLEPFGASVLHFHADVRLQRPIDPGTGVLAHITSLPAPGAGAQTRPTGTLGTPARAFVDWLAGTGARYWQVLPANPTDEFGSPYAGISAFAGNALLIEGASAAANEQLAVDHEYEYRAFCEREADWLEPYACFMAIRRKQGSKKTWQEWPKKFRRFDTSVIESDPKLAKYAQGYRHEQFAFERQWADVRSYANERGIQIIGDMPIYVSADSADVWANPGLFQVDADGNPCAVAGCPPDTFAADGQLWGNPLYDWDALREQGYAWWLRRLERAFRLYDWVRLDHFIGFARYYAIPAGKTALEGAYRPGPGAELFRTAKQKFGPLPVIAEDLGLLTPSIRALGASCGFPGMDILQFVDGNDPLSGYAPRPEKISYTGTHDNHTLVGYCQDRYPHLDAYETAAQLMKAVADCPAPVRIFPLQDLLGLGDEARMNTPGVAEGNWSWQADALPDELQMLRATS